MSFEDLFSEMLAYAPQSAQEAADKQLILDCCVRFGCAVLGRHPIAHLTASGFIVNAGASRVLLAHHNIRDTWAWTGGHADGDADLLAVSLREAQEETGLLRVDTVTPRILSLDVLPVFGHSKRGKWVSSHLHLSVSYLLWADESQPLHVKADENSGVQWFPADYISSENFSTTDTALYEKMLARAVKQLQPAPVQ